MFSLKKPDGRAPIGPWRTPLRQWQDRALERLRASVSSNFLIVATPGSGKTITATRAAWEAIAIGRARRIHVVTASDHLRRQWASAAGQAGLQLNPDLPNSSGVRDGSDFIGCVSTYQQIAAAPRFHRWLTEVPTFVILDEIHHAGEEAVWSDSLHEAFDPAARRLLLSGTPFRSDGKPIPWVEYVDDRCAPDFSYGYGEALADGVCRLVRFPTYSGDLEWLNAKGEHKIESFGSVITKRDASDALRAALLSEEWLSKVMRDADKRLSDIRRAGHRDAGGVVVTIDVNHARNIAEILQAATGEKPEIVVSEDADASDRIKRFADSDRRWIVSVRMISEGVDIPRLRVGIYACNILTEMYFRQFVGRFVRMQSDLTGDQTSYVYVPEDRTIQKYAKRIHREAEHALKKKSAAKAALDVAAEVALPVEQVPGVKGEFSALSGSGSFSGIVEHGDHFGAAELAAAGLQLDEAEMPRQLDVDVARIMRETKRDGFKNMPGLFDAADAKALSKESVSEQKRKLRAAVSRLIAQAATKWHVDKHAVNRRLYQVFGHGIGDDTLEELKKRLEHVGRMLKVGPNV